MPKKGSTVLLHFLRSPGPVEATCDARVTKATGDVVDVEFEAVHGKRAKLEGVPKRQKGEVPSWEPKLTPKAADDSKDDPDETNDGKDETKGAKGAKGGTGGGSESSSGAA